MQFSRVYGCVSCVYVERPFTWFFCRCLSFGGRLQRTHALVLHSIITSPHGELCHRPCRVPCIAVIVIDEMDGFEERKG